MSDTVEKWKKRVANWRASGRTAEAFSEGRPWSAKTLLWWSSRLARESTSSPVVRVAQLVRPAAGEPENRGAFVVGCGSFTTVVDGSNLDHLTSLSRGRSRGSGLGTSPSA